MFNVKKFGNEYFTLLKNGGAQLLSQYNGLKFTIYTKQKNTTNEWYLFCPWEIQIYFDPINIGTQYGGQTLRIKIDYFGKEFLKMEDNYLSKDNVDFDYLLYAQDNTKPYSFILLNGENEIINSFIINFAFN